MPENKNSPIILVTGANRGIGYNIIQSTAQRLPDATYILGCRSSKRGHEAVASLQKRGITAPLGVLELDVDDDNSICLAVSLLRKRFGRVDVLINAASLTLPPFHPSSPSSSSSFSSSPKASKKNSSHQQHSVHTSTQDLSHLRTTYAQTLSTNLTSVACLSQAFLPLLHSSILPLPKIINLSLSSLSTAADRDCPTSYLVSKLALEAFSADLRERTWAECEVYVVRPGKEEEEGEDGNGNLNGNEVDAVVRLVEAREGEYRTALGWEVAEKGQMREIGL